MSEKMTQLLAKLAAVTERAERAEAELAKLRAALIAAETKLETLFEQEPVAYVKYKQTGGNVGLSWVAIPTGAYPNDGDPLYAAPIPALAVPDSIHELAYELGGTDSGEYHLDPEALDRIIAAAQAMAAVPDWNVNIERIRDVMHMLGISIEESVECFSAALPTNINRMTLAMKRHLQKLAGMTAITPTPFIPDDDTRRNDAEFAAQQAAPSVSVIFDGLRDALSEIALRCTDSDTTDAIDALLQSADHSGEVKK